MKKLLLILWIILCVTSFKSTQANTVANDTIAKINFTVDNSLSAPGWDNVFGGISSPVTINNGIIITISGSPFKSGPSGEPNTVLPAKVGSTYNFLASSNNDPVILAFAGLDPVAKYTFAIFSSRAAAGTSGDKTTVFSIGSQSVSINALGNKSVMLSIPDVKSSASGSVELTISRPQGQAGYINALIITKSSTTFSNNLKQFNDVEIYPVPAKNYVNLSNLPVQSQIAVFDITGKKLIETANGNNPEIQVNVKSLNSGTYIFRIFNTSSIIRSYKIIKE